MASNMPAKFHAGDTIRWRDDAASDYLGDSVDSGSYTLTYYLRHNEAAEALTVVGTSYGTGWEFSIASHLTGAMAAGDWWFQATAVKTGQTVTLAEGQFQVAASRSYTGTATAYDGRTQAKKDLDDISAAIRALVVDKASRYKIGDREFERIDIPVLVKRESQLKGIVARERKASMIANGLGNPHVVGVRF